MFFSAIRVLRSCIEIAPPTSLANAEQVLKLEDKFAAGREFFDDDPIEELKKNGIVEANFTDKKAWDLFPVVQNFLRIWDICENYVKAFVANTYPTDAAVAADKEPPDVDGECCQAGPGQHSRPSGSEKPRRFD